MIYVLAAYSITLGVLALYGVLLQHRRRVDGDALARAEGTAASEPTKGFNLGASLLAPFWMLAHGLPIPGMLVLAVWIVLWPLYQRAMWVELLFAAAIPVAAGAALGFVGNRIAASRLGTDAKAELARSQLPWSLAGVVLFVFVLPWALFLPSA
ncbi:MAG: hypothetical protein JRG86_02705 [Deltaproteobacteria bacterium]|nr:hypothetical protein [Deltaproteobacteria bacterium]MBW2497567.1 hypothetical protein [Deltaproteobacteria bacterium]